MSDENGYFSTSEVKLLPTENLQSSVELPMTPLTERNHVEPSNSPPTPSRRTGQSRRNGNNEMMNFLQDEAIKEQARHDEVLAVEREKLALEKERIKALLDLKSILNQCLAVNQNGVRAAFKHFIK